MVQYLQEGSEEESQFALASSLGWVLNWPQRT